MILVGRITHCSVGFQSAYLWSDGVLRLCRSIIYYLIICRYSTKSTKQCVIIMYTNKYIYFLLTYPLRLCTGYLIINNFGCVLPTSPIIFNIKRSLCYLYVTYYMFVPYTMLPAYSRVRVDKVMR